MLDFQCPYCGASISEARSVMSNNAAGALGFFEVFCKCGKKYSFEIYAGGGSTSRNYGESAQK